MKVCWTEACADVLHPMQPPPAWIKENALPVDAGCCVVSHSINIPVRIDYYLRFFIILNPSQSDCLNCSTDSLTHLLTQGASVLFIASRMSSVLQLVCFHSNTADLTLRQPLWGRLSWWLVVISELSSGCCGNYTSWLSSYSCRAYRQKYYNVSFFVYMCVCACPCMCLCLGGDKMPM